MQVIRVYLSVSSRY